MELIDLQNDHEKLKVAKSLYLSGMQLTQISEELSIPLPLLREIAFNIQKWQEQRIEGTLPADFDLVRPVVLRLAESKAIKKVIESIDEVDLETVSDIDKMMSVVDKAYKIGRLEKGEATEIVDISSHGMTLREIMEMSEESEEDKAIETEYKEIQEE